MTAAGDLLCDNALLASEPPITLSILRVYYYYGAIHVHGLWRFSQHKTQENADMMAENDAQCDGITI